MNYVRRFVTLYRRQGSDHPQEKEMQESKMAVWGGLTNSCEKKRVKSKGEKERYTHLNAEFQRIAKRDKYSSKKKKRKKVKCFRALQMVTDFMILWNWHILHYTEGNQLWFYTVTRNSVFNPWATVMQKLATLFN